MKPPPVTFTRAAMIANPPSRAVAGPIPNHLRHVIGEAVRAFDRADFQTGLTNLCHAVYVAGVEGRGDLSDLDLIRELRKVAGFGFDIDEAPCP